MGDNEGCAIVGVLIIISAFCMFMAGFTLGQKMTRLDAVENSHAKWVADEKGNVNFVWNKEE